MKTKIKLLARLLMVTLLFSFMGCSEDVYENHVHSNSGKDEISFKQFMSETGITKFDYYKKANVSNSTDIQARTIESEFITDTIGIKKYVNPIDNKTTYTFKIYPIAEVLESKEYYNLVYEKIGNEWNEIIFFNTEKSNPTDARKLESSKMVYNRISGREGFSEVITYSIQCDGSCNGVCDGFACPTGQCIQTTITYVYTGIQDTSSGFNGNPTNSGNPSNTNPGGVGDIGNGIFIPNPYDGDADTNNQAFLLAGQVAAFTNTLPTNLQSLISNYNFVYPYIVDFCRNNGAVVNYTNKQQITNALNNFANFQLNNTYNNLTNVNKDRFNFWAFYTFLNNNPLNVNNTKINNIKSSVQSAEFETANSIVDYLYENKDDEGAIDFAEELIDLAEMEPNQVDVNNLVNISLIIEKGNYYYNDFDSNFINQIDPFIDLDLSNQDMHDPLVTHLIIKYNVLKALNPSWSKTKLVWETVKDVVHTGLDVFGLFPVFGEPADLINGVIYTLEGEHLNAGLSYAGAIPVLGWVSTTTKVGLKVVNTASTITTKVKLVWKVLPNGNLFFGSNDYCRKQLRKVLGMTAGNGLQAHHIIPLNLQSNPIVQKAAKSGSAFHMNEALNGIPLSSAVHSGSHGNYDGKILQKLQDFAETNPNATPTQCYNEVVDIINDIRTAIQNNPTTPINQLNF